MNGLNVAQHVKQVLSEKVEHVKTELLVKLGAPEKQIYLRIVMKELVIRVLGIVLYVQIFVLGAAVGKTTTPAHAQLAKN